MFLSTIISSYIGRNFLVAFIVLFAAFLLLILMIDTIELMRRTASRSEVSFNDVIQLALLKLPHIGQKIFPFAVLFAGMTAFWRLTRRKVPHSISQSMTTSSLFMRASVVSPATS